MSDFDFVLVGGGSAGCVLAARLSESGRHRVLLLEAGPDDRRLWIQLPLGYARSFYDPRVNWLFWSEPVASLGGRRIFVPRGKVLGGSGSINALVYSRGQPADYDAWAAEGNPGWGWRDVLPLYRRMERHAFGESDHHGGSGPLPVSDPGRFAHPLCRRFFAAAAALGFPFSGDLNGAETEGVGYYQTNTHGGWRWSAARAYLWPARRRPNLRIVTGALATRLLFEGRRAAGVEYRQGGERRTVRAARAVILAAGAIGSPQLLMLSGLGPAPTLARHGIAVLADLPAVGRHLHDHAAWDHVYRARLPTMNAELGRLRGQAAALLRFALFRRGPLAMSLNQAGGFLRTDPALPGPDVQLYFCPILYEKPAFGSARLVRVEPVPAFTLSASPCRPKSRGEIRLRSADPAEPPEIHPNLLAEPEDLRQAVAASRLMRRLAAARPLAEAIAAETKPGPAAEDADALAAYIRATAYSIFHPVGTCRMGPDPRAHVVDATLRVHGIEGLRVADASIFPAVTSGNTNAPAMMVGEKAADLILGRDAAG